MKLAILTQPLHTNFGGTLQNFALQNVLKQLGTDPVTINYRKKLKEFSPLRQYLSVLKQKALNKNVEYQFTSSDLDAISKNHKKFIADKINITEAVYELDDLISMFATGEYDAVIVGSDQTWRPRYSPRIDSFFLDFLSDANKPIKKLSYASSFGTDDWEFTADQTDKFSQLLKSFDFISVREKSAIDLCKNKFDVFAEHVLDPTLLLDREFYLDLSNNEVTNGIGKVFNYVLDKADEKNRMISKVCDLLEKDSFSTYPINSNKYSKTISDYNDYIYPKIEQWIKSFNDADFIITDSFHGTVFSIIFNKPFLSIANEGRGKARFTSLLSMFSLEDRLVSSVNCISKELVSKDIDFHTVNEVLCSKREESLSFLRKALFD